MLTRISSPRHRAGQSKQGMRSASMLDPWCDWEGLSEVAEGSNEGAVVVPPAPYLTREELLEAQGRGALDVPQAQRANPAAGVRRHARQAAVAAREVTGGRLVGLGPLGEGQLDRGVRGRGLTSPCLAYSPDTPRPI